MERNRNNCGINLVSLPRLADKCRPTPVTIVSKSPLTAPGNRGLLKVNICSPMSETLTKQQRSVLRVIETHQAAGDPNPSLREIGEELGLKNVSAVAKHVAALKRKGVLDADAGKARALRVTTPLANLRRRVVDIPVLGPIPAGFPDDGTPDAEGCVSVDVSSIGFTPTRNTFAVRVRGVSMIGRHILDGDIVLLERGPDPRNGQMVGALVDGERTLKTYVVKNGKPYLKAENPKYPDLIPAQELVIQGVFKGLIRKAD
jgi:repressor LexA